MSRIPADLAGRSAVVSPRAAERVRSGHPWVQQDDVLELPDGEDGVNDLVAVADRRDSLLGTAFVSRSSRIALRMVSRGLLEGGFDERELGERIVAAADRRERMYRGAFDAYRVVHGEADLLPGLFVDRYADVAVVQTGCAAMDAREPAIAEVLRRRLGVRLVVARDDGSVRDFDGLARRSGILAGAGPTEVLFHDAGAAVAADVLIDGKTGSFLDQQENHARAAEYARPGDEALDAFTYHGGFALALARAGARVLALDENAAAVERVRENAARNAAAVEARCANAFDVLRELESEGRVFDVVVIDPPALAKRRSALPAAERAYKELNLRGLRLVRPGGILVTCSCSSKLTADRFAAVVGDAARDAGRPVQVLERRGAGRDHPPLLGVPETEYLKCWILRVVA